MPTVTLSPELVRALVGDSVDFDAVAKMGPEPSDVHTPGLIAVKVRRRRPVAKRQLSAAEREKRENFERNVARASNAVGLAAGAAGTATSVQALRRHKFGDVGPVTGRIARATALKPKTVARLGVAGAAGATTLQTANVLGDVVTARVLGRDSKEHKVEKLQPLSVLRTGRLRSLGNALGIGGRHAPGAPKQPVATPLQAKLKTAQAAGAKTKAGTTNLFSTTAGKVGTAGMLGTAYFAGRSSGESGVYKAAVDDVTFGGTFSKFDNDKRQAFGWASVVELNGEPVVDRQGDYIGIDDIEEAAYAYIRKSRVAGDMHRRTENDEPFKAGEVIESVVFTKDKCAAMGLPQACAGKWWIGVQVDDDGTWEAVKKQARTGFSIHGKGLRKDTSLDEIRAS